MSKEKAVKEAAEPAARTVPETVAPARKKKAAGDLMYLGPTIAGAARRGTVFKDGILPKKAQECIVELPQMERLFVEVDRMPEAVRELGKKQSALKAVYKQAEVHFMSKNR